MPDIDFDAGAGCDVLVTSTYSGNPTSWPVHSVKVHGSSKALGDMIDDTISSGGFDKVAALDKNPRIAEATLQHICNGRQDDCHTFDLAGMEMFSESPNLLLFHLEVARIAFEVGIYVLRYSGLFSTGALGADYPNSSIGESRFVADLQTSWQPRSFVDVLRYIFAPTPFSTCTATVVKAAVFSLVESKRKDMVLRTTEVEHIAITLKPVPSFAYEMYIRTILEEVTGVLKHLGSLTSASEKGHSAIFSSQTSLRMGKVFDEILRRSSVVKMLRISTIKGRCIPSNLNRCHSSRSSNLERSRYGNRVPSSVPASTLSVSKNSRYPLLGLRAWKEAVVETAFHHQL
ncbi:unnamed protein product [Cercospora beticola]|nr:unnamed protein product [Cercospora beticola]